MHWYGGSIAEAVTLSKQKNAIFVVFVEGDNDLSVEMSSTLEDAAVLDRLSNQTNFLAIKLKSGSPNYTHFAQIYQFVPVPSLFFIGRNGTPLEVVCAGVPPTSLAERLDRILQQHHNEKPSVQPSSSSSDIKQQTTSLLQAESQPAPAPAPTPARPEPEAAPAAKVSKMSDGYEVVCDGDVCTRRPIDPSTGPTSPTGPTGPTGPTSPTSPTSPPGTSAGRDAQADAPTQMDTDQKEVSKPEEVESAASIEEKMNRAKELIEARQREKLEKEKQLAKEKEKERRNVGQGVAELKRWQAEEELKQLQEERKREKMANNLARQRVLEQIARDRAEQRARDAPPPSAPAAPAAPAPTAPATGGDGGGARIQFKLPDGSSQTAHFSADDTLATLHQYVAEHLQLRPSEFSLWTAFPRRELSAGAEGGASLRALQLAPSAALLVHSRRARARPGAGPGAVAEPSAITKLITFLTHFFTSFIVEPSQSLYAWLRTALPGGAGGARGSAGSSAGGAVGGAGAPRRRDNVRRLRGDGPNDDDNNTWNGNSTQQM